MSIATDKQLLERAASIKRRAEELEQELKDLLAGQKGTLARIKGIQNDTEWLQQVRDQYTESVSKRTLELNEEFPLRTS